MKSIKNIILGFAAAGMMTFAGCADDYLDTVPTNAVSDTTIKQSMENLYSSLNGIHRQMVSQESGYQCLGGLPGVLMSIDCEGDDITWQTNTWMKAAYLGWQCNMNETNGYNSTIWRLAYQWILNANMILEGLAQNDYNKLNKSDQTLYDQIKGECLCFRAYSHFLMVQLYAGRYDASGNNSHAGVPYRESSEACELARSSVAEVYNKINQDLDEAATLLSGKSLALSHYSEKVAWGLKSRVAMAMQDYSKAANYAEKAIQLAEAEGHALMSGSQLQHGFADITTATKEALYAAMTPDDMTVYFYSFYAYMSWNFNSTAIRQGVKGINAETYATMSATDERLAWWDPSGKMEVPSSSFAQLPYQNRKFTARSTSNAVGDFAFMRLAELYLTEAEALARSGQDAKAQEVFSKFQVTRDPEYISQGNTGAALAEEIMNSRRVELWGEGFRFFDLKRLHLDLVRGSNFDQSFCSFLTKDKDAQGWIWEIPRSETAYNTLCTKNY